MRKPVLRWLGWKSYDLLWSRPDERLGHEGLLCFALDRVWARSATKAVRKSRRKFDGYRIEEVYPTPDPTP